jgi:DNA-binding transcriptional MerR regulator
MTDHEMTIRQMCDAFDVTPRTLRFYEAKELLFPRREGQKRLFTRRDRARLKLILRGKRFGFSLEEIRQLLDLYYVGDQQATQLEATLDVARQRLTDMERKRDELTAAVDDLREQDEDGRGHAVIGRHRERRGRIGAAGRRLVMPSYTAPTKDMQYVLHDVLKITDAGIAGYADLDRDFTAAILEEAGKISAEVLAPLNPVGDTEGCRLENGIVYTPDGLQGRLRQMKENGWPAIDMPRNSAARACPT